MVRVHPDPPKVLRIVLEGKGEFESKREFKKRETWGCSSAGRAPALHAGGQEFDPPQLHQTEVKKIFLQRGCKVKKGLLECAPLNEGSEESVGRKYFYREYFLLDFLESSLKNW